MRKPSKSIQRKPTKFGLGVFQGKVIFINEFVYLQISKDGIKIKRLQVFTSLIHWLVYANVIIHRRGGE